ncbi:P1 family peptidase [Candidatus Amarobacter glycogenicus]|uniref:P1 family peptidase n=1 Tax=Candidatus Amarobacter glycogenicus TaxID=3140699 RepID=UPI0031362E5C|nr:P1 family peptidase [Dehalococcoidia bacterium]
MPLSNDDVTLEAISPAANRTLTFDLPGLSVGHAEYEAGPTGCTAFLFDHGWTTSVDKRGGLVGTAGDYEWMHALCFAGGSLPGLEATTGVARELWSRREHSTNHMPLVNGAIIYDYGKRQNTIHPDRELGRAAVRAAVPGVIALGARGAGRSATVGKMRFAPEGGGQGAAFREFGGVRLLVVTVVNALGAAIGRDGSVVRGNFDPSTGARLRSISILAPGQTRPRLEDPKPTKNTTLTLVATDAKLTGRELGQFARQVHTSMARAIDPFHTSSDGDTLYAATSNQQQANTSPDILGMVAGEVAWDAVLSSFDG